VVINDDYIMVISELPSGNQTLLAGKSSKLNGGFCVVMLGATYLGPKLFSNMHQYVYDIFTYRSNKPVIYYRYWLIIDRFLQVQTYSKHQYQLQVDYLLNQVEFDTLW
jgi:hypothetical protein